MVRRGTDFSNIEESTEIRNLYEISNDNVMLFINDTNDLKDCFSNKNYIQNIVKAKLSHMIVKTVRNKNRRTIYNI